MAQKFDADPNHIIPEGAKQTDTNLLEVAKQINPGVSWNRPLGGIGAAIMDKILLKADSPVALGINRVMDSNIITGNPQRAAAQAAAAEFAKQQVDNAARLGFNGANPITAPVANYDMPEIVKRGLAPATNKVLVETPPAESVLGGAPGANGGKGAAVPKNRNDELYAAINRLDDKQFQRFMKDNPDIPGLGYLRGADGKVVRFAENPDKKKPEPMSPIEMEAASKAMTGIAHLQAGIGARENAAATKQATNDYRQEALWEKGDKSLQDIIGVLGKDSLTGDINPELAYYKMGRDNVPLHKNLSPESRELAQRAIKTQMQPILDDISAFEAQYKRKPTDAERLTITKAYEKRRGWSF